MKTTHEELTRLVAEERAKGTSEAAILLMLLAAAGRVARERGARAILTHTENHAQGSHATASEMRTIRSHQYGQRVYSLRAQLAEAISSFLES